MIPEGHELGQGARAALAAMALGVTALIIYGLFSSGFGRPPRLALPTPRPAPVPFGQIFVFSLTHAPMRAMAASASGTRPAP